MKIISLLCRQLNATPSACCAAPKKYIIKNRNEGGAGQVEKSLHLIESRWRRTGRNKLGPGSLVLRRGVIS